MSRSWKRAALIVLTLTAATTFLMWISLNDLSDIQWFRSSKSIEDDLFTLMKEKNYEEAKVFLQDNYETLISASDFNGFISRSGEVVGEKNIYVILGGYRILYVSTDASARLGYDQDGNLLKVEVTKYKDSL